MDRWLRNFDRTSFWLGFLAGFLALWLLGRLKPLFIQLFRNIHKRITEARISATAGADIRLRNAALLRAQSAHLAASLFSLDEILVPPRLMVPPARVVPGEPPGLEDVATQVVPYMPDWPEMAALYRAPTFTLAEALQGGTNLVIIGLPGSGKTVALADLASRMARREPLPGNLEKLTPIYLHAMDFSLPAPNPEAPLEALTAAIRQDPALQSQAKLPEFLALVLDEGQALLLVDGLDELPQAQVDQFSDYLGQLKSKYPLARMVLTASLEYYGGLAKLGCAPVAVSAWEKSTRVEFTRRWGELWQEQVQPKTPAGEDSVDENLHLLTNAWLLSDRRPVPPLELTLRVWAAYAGDQQGNTLLDAIEAFVRRMAYDKDLQPIHHYREAMEQAALQMVLNQTPFWTPSNARLELAAEEPVEPAGLEENEPEVSELPDGSPQSQTSFKKVKIAPLLPALLDNGLLKGTPSKARFSHLEICAYLAGCAMGELLGLDAIFNRSEWREKPVWDTRNEAMGYFLAFSSNAPRAIEHYLNNDHGPLHQHLLSSARWLRNVPVNVPWRNTVMRRLVAVLQVRELSAGLRGRALSAMVTSNTPGVQNMLRQMSASQDSVQRQLAPLGAGLYFDDTLASEKTVVDTLVSSTCALLGDTDLVVRRTACLGLVAIGTQPALEAVADALLTGDDDLRQFAAEALANDSEEGHPTLQEGMTIDDVLVRRAVVHGLLRVREPWAIEGLQKMQLEDQEWVVQNAAGHALEQLDARLAHVPQPFTALTETPWLIAFGGEQGIGVSPGKPAYDLLLKALQEGRMDQQLAALDYVRQYGDENAAEITDRVCQEFPGEVREAAFNTLWHLSAAGITPITTK